ncbi:MAG: response regulator [Chthoniobacterales bacterium]
MQHGPEIQLILTDMAMPFIDGPTLVRTLRRMNPQIRILISTGRYDDCRSAELKGLHVEACLPQPYTRQQLLASIHQTLRDPAPRYESDPHPYRR